MAARRSLTVTSRPKFDLCPVTETAKIIGKKWYLIILHELTRGPMGFNELKRAVRGISAKVLSENLVELDSRGLLTRSVYSASPMRVEYALTDKGRELDGIFLSMRVWGEKWAVCASDDETSPDIRPRTGKTDKELPEPVISEDPATPPALRIR